MTPATNNRNAQAFWEARVEAVERICSGATSLNHEDLAVACMCYADLSLALWLDRFGTPEERVQFEEWQQAQYAGNEGEAGT